MKLKFRIVLLSVLIGGSFLQSLNAQELRCMVQVVAPSVQGTNRAVFETLQKTIMEYMNGQQWGNHKFKNEERIDCTILINIREMPSIDEFKGTFQIQARRPVHNSSYNSQLINFMDQNLSFKYVEFEPFVYNESNMESNLVAMLSYYAYIILGYDYDSFSPRGGTSYFQKAEHIVSMMQNSKESGWRSFDGTRNRYWLTENLLNEQHTPLRTCYYEYHRKGLDLMAQKPEEGRSNILSALEQLTKVYRQRPNSFALSFFFDAKSEELINIFSEAPSMEKGKVITILSEIDPANSNKYNKMK